MAWWVLALAVLSVLSYLSDVGLISWLNMKVPFLNASLLSVLILLTAAGGLARILSMRKKGRRELMAKKIEDLEAKLAALAALKK